MARDLREDVRRSQAAGVPSLFTLTDTRPVLVSLFLAPGRTFVVDPDRAYSSTLAWLHGLSPEHFEQVVAQLLWRMGYKDVVVTPYRNDGGIDITATYQCGPISAQHFVFQVKRHRRKVGRRVFTDFRGVLDDDVQGVLVAAGGFYPTATALARQSRRPVQLIDGDALARLLIQYGFGDTSRRPRPPADESVRRTQTYLPRAVHRLHHSHRPGPSTRV